MEHQNQPKTSHQQSFLLAITKSS